MLQSIPFFSGCGTEFVFRLAARIESETFGPGEVIFREGDTNGDSLCVVYKGTAQVEVTCLRGAELRRHVCKAVINVDGRRTAILRFRLNVVARQLDSPPVSPWTR